MPSVKRAGMVETRWMLTWLAEPGEAFRVLEPGPFPIAIAEEDIPEMGLRGAVIGRTAAEAAAGTPFGLAAAGDTDVYIVFSPSPDPDEAAVTALSNNALIYHELLPGWADLAPEVQALVRARYRCRLYPMATA